jgi:hypothetical protein
MIGQRRAGVDVRSYRPALPPSSGASPHDEAPARRSPAHDEAPRTTKPPHDEAPARRSPVMRMQHRCPPIPAAKSRRQAATDPVSPGNRLILILSAHRPRVGRGPSPACRPWSIARVSALVRRAPSRSAALPTPHAARSRSPTAPPDAEMRMQHRCPPIPAAKSRRRAATDPVSPGNRLILILSAHRPRVGPGPPRVGPGLPRVGPRPPRVGRGPPRARPSRSPIAPSGYVA